MITKSLTVLAFFIYGYIGRSQHPIQPNEISEAIALNKASEKSELEKLAIEDSLRNLMRYHYDYLSFECKYRFALIMEDQSEKIRLLQTIRTYPYYRVSSTYYGLNFYNLYHDATQELIRLYRSAGKLEELYKLDIVESARLDLYGYLRQSIEALGGVWNRGDFHDPEMLTRGTRQKN